MQIFSVKNFFTNNWKSVGSVSIKWTDVVYFDLWFVLTIHYVILLNEKIEMESENISLDGELVNVHCNFQWNTSNSSLFSWYERK